MTFLVSMHKYNKMVEKTDDDELRIELGKRKKSRKQDFS